MKKLMGLTLSAAISFASFAQGQNENKQTSDPAKFEAIKGVIDSSKVYSSVEQFPEFEGGQKGLSSFLSNNIQYPNDARENEIQGRVVVRFVVCTDGSLCDETIMHSVDSSIDNEVLRVVKSMPRWKPGMQDGQPVKTYYLLPVTFKLQGQEKDTIPDARDYLLSKPNNPSVEPPLEKVYTSIENPPEFIGGLNALEKFLSSNVKYPNSAREDNIQGRIIMGFVIDKDGSVTDIQVKRDIGGGCGNEGIRVIKLMPKWKPGTQNGKPIKVQYILPITFKLKK